MTSVPRAARAMPAGQPLNPSRHLMKCAKCNAEVTPGERFCGECGQLVEEPAQRPSTTNAALEGVCSQCGTALKPTQGFCGSCGKRVAVEAPRSRVQVCSSCGTLADASESFCGTCGTALLPSTAPSPDSPQLRAPVETTKTPSKRRRWVYVQAIVGTIVVLLVLAYILRNTPLSDRVTIAATSVQMLFGAGASVYHTRGFSYFKLGQYDQAIQNLSEAIRLEPHPRARAQYYSTRGSAYRISRDYTRAIDDFTEAIRLESEGRQANDQPGPQAGYYANRASVYTDVGDYAGAFQDLMLAIKLRPEGYWAYSVSLSLSQLATKLSSLDRWPDAEAALREALRLQPASGLYHVYLAEVLLRQGRRAEAEQAAREAIRLGQKDHRVYKELFTSMNPGQ